MEICPWSGCLFPIFHVNHEQLFACLLIFYFFFGDQLQFRDRSQYSSCWGILLSAVNHVVPSRNQQIGEQQLHGSATSAGLSVWLPSGVRWPVGVTFYRSRCIKQSPWWIIIKNSSVMWVPISPQDLKMQLRWKIVKLAKQNNFVFVSRFRTAPSTVLWSSIVAVIAHPSVTGGRGGGGMGSFQSHGLSHLIFLPLHLKKTQTKASSLIIPEGA